MIGELYIIESKDLLGDIRKSYFHFIEKHGYAPEYIKIRARHCKKSKLRRSAIQKIGLKDIIVVARDIPLAHFVLFPIVKFRNPRVVNVERIPCL